MKIFNQIDHWSLERSEKHLWSLALGTIYAFAVAIALLVYPFVFLQSVTLGGGTLRKLFVGFCVLTGLLFTYLPDRHFLIRRLRRQLTEEKEKLRQVHQEPNPSLLESLAGPRQFHSRVALEYQRAASTHQCLSLLVVALTLHPDLAGTAEAGTVTEMAALTLIRKLWGEDSVYLTGATNFCIVLPGVNDEIARLISTRVSEGLSGASGFGIRFSFEVRTLNYPTDVKSALELEAVVRLYVDEPDQEVTVMDAVLSPAGQI